MTALKVDGGVSDWTSVDAAGTQFNTLALAKLPEENPEEILAQGEFRVNVPSAEVWKLVLPARVATPMVSTAVTESTSGRGDDVIPDVVQQFAKLFAKEIVASGSLDRTKAKPPVFRGTADKLSCEVWLAQFEHFVKGRDPFDVVMIHGSMLLE